MIARVLRVLISAFVLLLFVTLVGFTEVLTVRGESMERTLSDGNQILVLRTHRLPATAQRALVERGSVVVVADPSGRGRLLVKRLVAQGHQRVRLTDGILSIDGLPDNSVDSALTTPGESWGEFSAHPHGFEVPPEEYFVLGDNRTVHGDSRAFGPIRLSQIRGLLLLSW